MTHRQVLQIGGIVALVIGMGCGGELVPEGTGNDARASTESELSSLSTKVLILGSTVTDGSSSDEAVAARALGYTVEVASDFGWRSKTAADFATYRAIILGDATCTGLGAAQAALDTRAIWGPVVTGNVILVGTDPVFHTTYGPGAGPAAVTNNAVKFAAADADKTGAYISLSCYYHDTSAHTPVPLLSTFGAFTLTGVGCYNDAHIVATHPALSGLTDSGLSNWSCSVHEAFDGFPEERGFAPLAIARDPAGSRLPGSKDFADGSHGVPYILARGATPVLCGDSIIQPPEQCDNGSLNGTPGTPCSSTCRLHWCGDGVVDSAEECDEGAGNSSTGTCSTTCKSLNRPPVTLCKDITLTADAVCGASGSINNGSYDPDGNLVSCIQSPAGPYGLGTTSVVLNCTDSTGATSSCRGSVSVVDRTAPAITCPAAARAECVNRGAYFEPGAAAVSDNCGPPAVMAPAAGIFPLGTTPLTYSATDGSGNSTSCTTAITVSDTTPPTLSLLGAQSMTLECGVDGYVEPGATAADACFGDLTDSIVLSGSVDTSTPGSYTLRYDVQDGAGLAAPTQTRSVTVRDTLPPQVTLKTPVQMWPPNHRMWSFHLSDCATVTDACDTSIDINAAGQIISIYSDELEDANGVGDGQTTDDIAITSASSFELRSERDGRFNGRIYGVRFRVTDANGNQQQATCHFAVPHDQSGDAAIDNGPSAGYSVNAP